MATEEEECLTENHIVQLSERMATETEVRNLGMSVLKLSRCEVQSALTSNSKDIQSAASEVLHKWLLQQESRQQALRNLIDSLRENKINLLVTELMVQMKTTDPPKTGM